MLIICSIRGMSTFFLSFFFVCVCVSTCMILSLQNEHDFHIDIYSICHSFHCVLRCTYSYICFVCFFPYTQNRSKNKKKQKNYYLIMIHLKFRTHRHKMICVSLPPPPLSFCVCGWFFAIAIVIIAGDRKKHTHSSNAVLVCT